MPPKQTVQYRATVGFTNPTADPKYGVDLVGDWTASKPDATTWAIDHGTALITSGYLDVWFVIETRTLLTA